MDHASFWRVFIACIGFGIGGQLMREWLAYKKRRREMPYDARNAGIWTDGRLKVAEITFWTVTLGPILYVCMILILADRVPFQFPIP